MLRKWALSVPVAWWYSITQQLLRISPLLSLPQERTGSGRPPGLGAHVRCSPLAPPAPAPAPHCLSSRPPPQHTPQLPGHYLRVLSFFSRALACCSLMMVAFTWGGFMCTFSFPPTRSRTVAANLVCVFSTWGGCFSMMKVLGGHGDQGQAGRAAPIRPPHPARCLSQAGPPPLPGHQGRDDVSDGAVQLRQHLLHRARDRQLLAQVFSPADLLPVLPDDLRQLLAPGGSGAQHRARPQYPIPPCQAGLAPAPTSSAARPGCPQGDPRFLLAAADASTGSAHHPVWSSAACAAAAASSGASRPGPARRDGVTGHVDGGTASMGPGQRHSPHGTAVVSGPPGAARPPATLSSAAASSPVTGAPGDPAGRAGRTGLGDGAQC